MSRLLALTTDYGTSDGYVGALKGVVLGLCADAIVVDLCHLVPPQDVLYGAVVLRTAAPEFPADTVHLVVVDPEVGSDRAGLIVRAWDQWFVAPDSGVLHFALMAPRAEVYRLRPELRQPRPGTTFDGRDWFAPAAAALATGTPVAELGEPVDDAVLLTLPTPVFEPYRWVGHVLHVDRFGNLVSDLPAPVADARATARVFVKNEPVGPVRAAFAAVAEGAGVATVGALGTVEVGVYLGDAARKFRVRRGEPVEILFPTPQDPPADLLS